MSKRSKKSQRTPRLQTITPPLTPHRPHRHLLDTLEPRMLLSAVVGSDLTSFAAANDLTATVMSLDGSTPTSATSTEANELAALKQAYIDYAAERYQNWFGKEKQPGAFSGLVAYALLDQVTITTASGLVADSSDLTSGGTNTQQRGIDEADLIKTDGRFIYSLSYRYNSSARFVYYYELTVVDTAIPDDLRVVSRTTFEAQQIQGFYLHDGQVITVGAFYDENEGEYGGRVNIFEISDGGELTLVEQNDFEGSLLTSRLQDGKLQLITRQNAAPPAIRYLFDEPDENGRLWRDDLNTSYSWRYASRLSPEGIPEGQYETEEQYRTRLEAMPIEALMPSVTTRHFEGEDITTTTQMLADPTDVLLDDDGRFNPYMLGVIVMDLDDAQAGVTDALLLPGSYANVYISNHAIYLATTVPHNSGQNGEVSWWSSRNRDTKITKLVVGDDGQVTRAATGRVKGTVLNEFSMDEHNGYLRVTTTENNNWFGGTRGNTNHLFVLQQVGDELVTVGQINDIAPDERIFSMRFDGDRAVMTTGIIIVYPSDPIFTLDLSDPTAPTISGELVTPAFSTYMHQVGDDLFLGIGDNRAEQDWGGRWWRSRGRGDVRLSLVDVSDFDEPRESDTYVIEDESRYGRSYSEAQWDHHAFQYYDDLGLAILPATARDNDPDTVDNADLYLFDIDAQTGITSVAVIDHEDSIRRSIRIGDTIFAISNETITAHAVGNLSVALGEVDLINAEILAPHEIAKFDIGQGIAYVNTSAVASATHSLFSLLSSQTDTDFDSIDDTQDVMTNGSLDLGL